MTGLNSVLQCVRCGRQAALTSTAWSCACGGLYDVLHDFSLARQIGPDFLKLMFSQRRAEPEGPADRSGVWRFRELVMPGLPTEDLVTRGEGNTRLYRFPKTAAWTGLDDLRFKHEGENPTGSFKDRGLTVAVSWAKRNGAVRLACASTGNTSASVASYASLAGLPAIILIAAGKTALGKIAQALAYGARTVEIRGDFDAAMRLVLEAAEPLGLTVLNSVNPFRLEGRKAIILEMLEQLGWQPPDWIVVPGGNLGNTSAFGKALAEAQELGLIDRLPRLAVIQATGADPFYRSFLNGWRPETVAAETIATAIRIGRPVNFDKAVRAVRLTGGLVAEVTDQEIMEAKAVIDSDGVGAEPASCATAAGIRRLVTAGTIRPDERVVGVLTGHFLKDPEATIGYHGRDLAGLDCSMANSPVTVDPDLESLRAVLTEG